LKKPELVDAIIRSTDMSKKDATAALDTVIDHIIASVARGEEVAISGLGKFKRADRKARVGRNPQTGEAVQIKATSVPKFLPAKEFKEVVSGKRQPPVVS
jgi:DNA-binding protein HU-beta